MHVKSIEFRKTINIPNKMWKNVKRSIPIFDRMLLELNSNCNRDCFFCNRTFDTSGKRLINGKRVLKNMPTEHVLRIMDEAVALGFRGKVAFHHMSEAFLDKRVIRMAWEARTRGLIPYEHTNGDVLRNNLDLCRQAAEVFDYITVGLYDYKNEQELKAEQAFWKVALKGTRVKFSLGGEVYPRSLTPFDSRMFRDKKSYQHAPCTRPFQRLIVHYDGNVALCCEDMTDMFNLGNAFKKSIEEIWYSKRHVGILRDLEQGRRDKYPACKNCPMPPVLHDDPNWTYSRKGIKSKIKFGIKRFLDKQKAEKVLKDRF